VTPGIPARHHSRRTERPLGPALSNNREKPDQRRHRRFQNVNNRLSSRNNEEDPSHVSIDDKLLRVAARWAATG